MCLDFLGPGRSCSDVRLSLGPGRGVSHGKGCQMIPTWSLPGILYSQYAGSCMLTLRSAHLHVPIISLRVEKIPKII